MGGRHSFLIFFGGLVLDGVDEDSENKVSVRVLHGVTFHHDLVFLKGLLAWLYHADLLSLCTLINVLGQVETAHADHIGAAVKRKFHQVWSPHFGLVVKALYHFLVEGLFNFRYAGRLLYGLQIGRQAFAVASKLDAHLQIGRKDRDLGLFDDKTHLDVFLNDFLDWLFLFIRL